MVRKIPANKRQQIFKRKWVQSGFADFSRGEFGSGGDNLYANANGEMEMIHRTDINNDGYVDIVLPNSHGYIERGPTRIYTQAGQGPGRVKAGTGKEWPRRELPNDSSWMSRVADVDEDGYQDLVVVNGENGVTSELNSYIYWGGPNGLTGERTEFATAGAYDVAIQDITGNGLPDLIFPSAWVDHHNPGRPRQIQVFEQVAPRKFVDASEHHGLIGIAATSVFCGDLNGDGRPELVVANYRKEFEYDTNSFLYWGTTQGFNAQEPLCLPTHNAMQVIAGDLSGNGWNDIVFTGGNKIYIYWNDQGAFSREKVTTLDAEGMSTMFCVGAVRAEIADVDGDGKNELLVATVNGVEIRARDDFSKVRSLLPMKYCTWVAVLDLDNDGRPDIITSKYHDGCFYESSSAVFWNGPEGFSPERATWLPTAGTMGCTAGDLDGDGRPEIIYNNTMRGWSQFNPEFPAYVYLGNKKHEYGLKHRLELPTGGGTNTYVIADTNLDGYPELIITTGQGLRIFPGGPDGPKPDCYLDLPHLGNFFMYVLVADLNKNGWLDLIGGAYTYDSKPETMARSSVIYWGGPEGFSIERSTVLPTYTGGQICAADLNKNGWLDIIYGDTRGFIGIYRGGPNGYSPDRMIKLPLEGSKGFVGLNCVDINNDGWLEIIFAVMGHYTRKQSGFYIFYGGPNGFSSDRMEFHPTEASSVRISAADINKNGHLDLLVPAYSTQFRRDLPAFIFWGDGKSFDFENPYIMQCNSCCAYLAVDITGNGYPDVLAICHRDDLGHQVDSLLFWNGPEGLSADRVTRLPGLGPHLASSRDFGNTYTREPIEYFISSAEMVKGMKPAQISWEADVPDRTGLRFQLRWAKTERELVSASWCGPEGENSFYERPGQEIRGVNEGIAWIQYKAVFSSPNGCRSAKLRKVKIDLC